MSIFDKFNANPYIKTYAGAPINEAMEVVKGLNARADKNIATMTKTDLEFAAIPTFGQADKAYKALKQAEIDQGLQDIMEAPEHATMKVRRMATEFATDPNIRNMKATAAAAAEWNKKYGEDAAKYGDVAAWEFQQAMDAYEKAGGAAKGNTFSPPKLREIQDINKFLLDNGKAIASMQEGVAYENGKFINTETREFISPDRVEGILQGALANNPQLLEQMQRQLRMENSMRAEGTPAKDMQTYLSEQVAPMVSTFSFEKIKQDMKGAGKGNETGFTIGSGMFDYNGQDITFDMSENTYTNSADYFDRLKTLEASNDPRDVKTGMKMRMSYKNAVRAMAEKENFDPVVTNFLLNASYSDMPISRQVQVGMNAKMGTPIYDMQTDFSAFEKYAQSQGFDVNKLDRYKQQIERGLNSSVFQTTVRDVYESSNQLTMDTQFTNIAASLDLTQTDVQRMNQMFAGSLSGKDVISKVDEEGNVVEVSGEDFREDYNVNSVKLISADTNGTGAVNVQIEDENGVSQNMMIIANPNEDQVFRVMGNGFAYSAKNAPSMQGKLEAARKGVNFVMPQITRSAEMVLGVPTGEAVPIDFGDYDAIVGERIGNITMKMDANGDFIAQRNGQNLFANSPDFTNLAAEARTPQEMATVINQYVRQNL